MKNMTIGVLYCGFGNIEYVQQSMPVWLQTRDQKIGGHQWVISAVSVPFKEYKDTSFANDECATEYLKTLPLDYLVTEPKFVSEAEARNKALFYLLEQGCDWVWLADSDEMITLDNIINLALFIERDTLTTWFSFSYKNYVFNENTYLEDPFCPPRAFKVNSGSYILTAFYHDNEVYYTDINRGTKDFKMLGSRNIPKNTCFIKHLTWLSDERSRLKTEYQSLRWKSENCSYRWNYQENKLEFNPEYFQKFNKTLPKVLTD